MIEGISYEAIIKKFPFGYAFQKILLDENGIPADFEFIEINEAFERIIGLSKDMVIGKKATEILSGINNKEFDCIKRYGDIALNNCEYEFQQYFVESGKWYKIKAYSPKKYYFITYLIDITNEIKEKELLKNTFLSIVEGIITTDLDGKITLINNAAEKLTGWKKEEAFNQIIFDIFDVYDSQNNSKFTGDILSILNDSFRINERENLILKSKNGIDTPVVLNISPIKDKVNKLYGMIVSFKDITKKINKEKAIDYITYHDSLTEVYNRTYFNEQIKKLDVEDNLPISIIMGDVNGLKLTNDAFGHLMGDKLLKSAAHIMGKVCRDNDIVIRWGGDEFIIILPKTTNKEAAKVSERIKEECTKENIGVLNISISLGYDTKKAINEDIMKTITNAEEMMYKIKLLESKSMKSRTLKVIIKTLHEKSERDELHSRNTSKICKLIGEALNLSVDKISELEVLGEIHDIGKVTVPKIILNKDGKLTEEEWEEIKKHPQVGYHIVSSSGDISFLAECTLLHHERYDGTGYPKGLKGEEIPLLARILTIADAYDAMVNHRPYKKSQTKEEAIKELIKNSGTQFDPKLVEAFVDKVAKKL